MREFDALHALPTATLRRVSEDRDIRARLVACNRGAEFFDGDRRFGYGGYVDDGRWGPVAVSLMQDYSLHKTDAVLQVQCEKGFLLTALRKCGLIAMGTENAQYPLREARRTSGRDVIFAEPRELPFQRGVFDLVVAVGVVYALTLQDALRALREIQRVGKGRSFITLGSYESGDDLALMREWSLLGCTLLAKPEWLEVLKEAGYTGDYKFVTARTLGLTW